MIKILRFYLFLTGFVMFSAVSAYAQNCTVNAGINKTICPGQPFILTGAQSGLFNTTANWLQVSGPSVTISATTISSGSANATVTGFTSNVNYVFRLSAKCTDGSLVYQDVTYIVSDLGTVNAGLDNYGCPGTPYNLQGSALGTGETGLWTIVAGGVGPTISSPTSNNATFTFPTRSDTQAYTFRWTVSKTTGGSTCSSYDDVIITNLGTAVVDAGTDRNLSCYNVTTSTTLDGSDAGTNATYGQSVLWTVVSGPSTPTFDSNTKSDPKVSNLIQGTYVFRYTVTGPCVSGNDLVSVIVTPASQNNTNAGSGTQTYCDNRTTTVLSAPKALYDGETMTWSPVAGVTIASPNSNVTTVSGLSGINGTTTTFTYTITNTITGCSSTGNYNIVFRAAPTISITGTNPIFATCGVSTAVVNYIQANGTGTQYALTSAPTGSVVQTQMGGLNNYTDAPASGTILTGFDKIGTYVISYRRNTDNGNGGCQDAYADVTIVVSAAPTASNAGTAQVLACNVVATALAGNPPVIGTGKWSQISGPNTAVIANVLDNNTPITGLIAGLYTFRWIISGGDGACVNAQSDVTVKVSTTTPTASVVGSDASVCNSSPITLTGNTPLLNETGVWTVTKSPGQTAAPEVTFSNVNTPSAVANGLLASTTYTFTWTITNACSPTFPGSVAPASYTLTTTSTAGPKQAVAGADQCLVSGSTLITLSGNIPVAPETGSWTKISGPAATINSPTSYNSTVTVASDGIYVFQWKLEKNGCIPPSIDQVTITISAAATPANAGTAQNICGTSVTLNGNTPAVGTGVWTQTEGAGGAIITDTADPGTTVTGLTGGRYKFTWTITNGACASSTPSEVIINVSNPSSTAVAGGDQAICNATTATLAATPLVDGAGNWSTVSGPSVPTFANSASPTTAISNLKYGKYVLRWTSRGGIYCPISTDDVEITVTQNANAGTDKALCGATSVTLTGNENSSGIWTGDPANPAGASITAVGTNGAIVTGLLPGVYKFKYTLPVVGTCPATDDEVQITIEAAPSPAVAGPDQAKCQLTVETSTVFAMDATTVVVGTGKWVLLDSSLGIPNANNPVIANINDPKTNITVTTPGVFLYEWTVENVGGACAGGNANADIVRITAFKEPSPAVAGPNQASACSDKVIMAATAPTVGLGTWSVKTQPGGSPVVVFEEINSPTTKINGLSTGNYTFTWTVSNGSPTCASKTADVIVAVTTLPVTIANAGTDISVCKSLPTTTGVQLNGNTVLGSETGTWTIISQPAGSVAFFNFPNSNTAIINGLNAATGQAFGEYVLRWTIKNTGGTASDCDSFDEVKITVYNDPSVSDAGLPQTVCNTSSVTLAATAVPSVQGIGTWSNKVGNPIVAVFSDVNSPTSGLTGLIAGSYTLIWTVSNGNCVVSTSEVTITVSNCEIAVAKSTSTPVQQADGSYNLTLTFKVKNTGNAPLTGIQVEDNLKLTFPSPKTWTVSSLSATGTLVANATTGTGSFTGNTGIANQQLLTNASSLAVGVTETITLVLNVKFN